VSKERYATITVTVEMPYVVRMIDNERTEINGYTVQEVIDAWFTNYDINRSHASRDCHRLGGGLTIVGVRSDVSKTRDVK
jgi:hypothetical protein